MDFIIPPQVYSTVPGVPSPPPTGSIRTSAVTVGPGSTVIVPLDVARLRVIIKNTTAGTGAVIGNAADTWALGAFLLGGGETVTLTGVEAVYGDSAAGVLLSVLEELS